MKPDRGIVHTYRQSDSLSTRPDDQNNLTCQSANTNNPPEDSLHFPVTIHWNIIILLNIIFIIVIYFIFFTAVIFVWVILSVIISARIFFSVSLVDLKGTVIVLK